MFIIVWIIQATGRSHKSVCITHTAGGLAVDWIYDKLYWTEEHRIMEYDLSTESAIEIATMTGTPGGIGVFPCKDNV